MNKRIRKTCITICMMIALAAGFLCRVPVAASVSPEGKNAHPSTSGALHVEDGVLKDASGKIVRLKGVSSHGLGWYGELINYDALSQISEEWDANVVRLAMYSAEYSKADNEEKKEILSRMKGYIVDATRADMYVIVDWHILSDNNPYENMNDGVAFLSAIARTFKDQTNIIYEICNEPNGKTVEWKLIKEYATRMISMIRSLDSDAICIVGTPEYSSRPDLAADDPILYQENIMYTMHFYAGTHKDTEREYLKKAIEKGLAVFCTECNLSTSTGDGGLDYEEMAKWFDLIDGKQLSYCAWSFSNKNETSALIKASCRKTSGFEDSDLTDAGLYFKAKISGGTLPTEDKSFGKRLSNLYAGFRNNEGRMYLFCFGIACVLVLVLIFVRSGGKKKRNSRHQYTYDDLMSRGDREDLRIKSPDKKKRRALIFGKIFIIISAFTTLTYLQWRIFFTIPVESGWLSVVCNLLLLAVELLGFAESMIHYFNMIGLKEYRIPEIRDDQYPDVDIFIATYNESTDLLRMTINGCLNMDYPDKKKVHIYLCDDNRRPAMRALAEELGINYFDRPDNKGAKAGNLNCAMARTRSPYVVTFDADMIPRHNFLLATIPYFVDAELRNEGLPEEEQIHLGLLQSPQAFYTPDVYQHNLYAETRIPNEQDFFYRTIEVARTQSNSVIYGGSNTVIARRAIEDVGGFFTESITEDFATGILIEQAGYVSMAVSEPLATGMAPDEFNEYIKQRTRWGRGVIVTARKVKYLRSKGLTAWQKINYWSSVTYWWGPIKNMIYFIMPLLFALFGINIMRCSLSQILMFWLPMFLVQNLVIRLISGNSMSLKWAGIQDTLMMPPLLIPIVKELLGITLSTFKVTDKGAKKGKRKTNWRGMMPYIIMTIISLIGIARTLYLIFSYNMLGLWVIIFWLVRNLYFLTMSIFIVDGRDPEYEDVIVKDAEPVMVTIDGLQYEGITTRLTTHNIKMLFDVREVLTLGQRITVVVDTGRYCVNLNGVVTDIQESRNAVYPEIFTMAILDFNGNEDEYKQILFDRVPTLPQKLRGDYNIIWELLKNIAKRISD